MRHRKSGRRLNRTSAHRKAMFANLAASLFRHEQIKTTLPKAKELRRVAEPLITLAKTASLANRRMAFARLREHEVVGKLFDDLGPHFADRPGGYLRILKCGYRNGDAAPMAYVQLVDRDFDGGDDGEDVADEKDAVDAKDAEVGGGEKETKPAKSKAKSGGETSAKAAQQNADENAGETADESSKKTAAKADKKAAKKDANKDENKAAKKDAGENKK